MISVSMYRCGATTASGVVDATGHYFYLGWNETAASMIISDCSSVSARFMQKTAGRPWFGFVWLTMFLEVVDLHQKVEDLPRPAGLVRQESSTRGKLSHTNQTIFSRQKGDQLSLFVSEGTRPAVNRSDSNVVAAFTQTGIEHCRMDEVLEIWVDAYKRCSRKEDLAALRFQQFLFQQKDRFD